MTLKQIQAQYGDGVWLLLLSDDDLEWQILFEVGWVHQRLLGSWDPGDCNNLATWSVRSMWTILDVEDVTIAPTLVVTTGKVVPIKECTCPTLLNGHHGGCAFLGASRHPQSGQFALNWDNSPSIGTITLG